MDNQSSCDVRSVANHVLDERERFGLTTTHLSLQKLVYFCHGMHVVRFGTPLVDGYFEAWEHGPVHPFLYQVFKNCDAAPIMFRCEMEDMLTGTREIVPPPEQFETRNLVSEIVLQMRSLTASQLRAKSHAVGGPWHSIWSTAKKSLASSLRIPDHVIGESYFRHMSSVETVNYGAADAEDQTIEPYRSSQ